MNKLERMYKETAYFINNRPLCMLTVLFAVRDFVLGLGILIQVPELMRTLLVQNLESLWTPWPVALFIAVTAVVTSAAAIYDWNKLTRFGLTVQSNVWLFICLTYVTNGNFWLAAIFGILCSAASGYVGYYYKWASIWDAPKLRWRTKYGLPN